MKGYFIDRGSLSPLPPPGYDNFGTVRSKTPYALLYMKNDSTVSNSNSFVGLFPGPCVFSVLLSKYVCQDPTIKHPATESSIKSRDILVL